MPLAVMGFQGRLVAGVGKALRIYDLGKKKLLRKAENKVSSYLVSAMCSIMTFESVELWRSHCHSQHPGVANHRR